MAKKQKGKKSGKSSGPRTTVDDPVNDIHDDELYDEETGLRKDSSDGEEYERPW